MNIFVIGLTKYIWQQLGYSVKIDKRSFTKDILFINKHVKLK